jgi:hypothetical protein
VIDVVKQALDVKFQDPVTLPASLSRDPNCIQRRFIRPVAIGICQEDWVQDRLNHQLNHHLCHAIRYSRHTQNPFSPTLFRNGDGAHRWWKIASRAHPIPDPVQIA